MQTLVCRVAGTMSGQRGCCLFYSVNDCELHEFIIESGGNGDDGNIERNIHIHIAIYRTKSSNFTAANVCGCLRLHLTGVDAYLQ